MFLQFIEKNDGSICFPEELLQSYMHTTERTYWIKENMKTPVEENIIANTEIIDIIHTIDEPQSEDIMQTRTFQVKHIQDKLFGAIYMANYGYKKIKEQTAIFGKIDTAEKQKIIDFLRINNNVVLSRRTNYSLTKTLCNTIMNDLATQRESTYQTLIAYTLYYKCNIYIVDTVKKIYIPFLYFPIAGVEDDEESFTVHTYVLYKNPENHKKSRMSIPGYFVDIDQSVQTVEKIRENMVGFVHYDKPLKGISSYKVSDLECMSEKLELDHPVKIKKSDLYEKICIHCASTEN
jgi:hypothetical protein